ncbi:copper-binding protein [Comamonas sp. Y33R10-2]|uniref:copper-binding protein n=1 Tax=Comamonas sp. Y33R10-2 TaxID=2853257 RepID=UPI001C5C94B1|nr:copper-binding protein [Comamonas sp. Y33R10-2]QXZ08413.1 copper-binding protein [Comamonas sp. Y33R10-2]
MKKLLPIIGLSAALTCPAFAQNHSDHSTHSATQSSAQQVMTAGEITRIDTRSGQLTIRHEEIKNLDMPAMTMVFVLTDSAKPADFKKGDKVLFHAEEKEGVLLITHIQLAV